MIVGWGKKMTTEEETKTKNPSKEPVEIKPDPELKGYVYNQEEREGD